MSRLESAVRRLDSVSMESKRQSAVLGGHAETIKKLIRDLYQIFGELRGAGGSDLEAELRRAELCCQDASEVLFGVQRGVDAWKGAIGQSLSTISFAVPLTENGDLSNSSQDSPNSPDKSSTGSEKIPSEGPRQKEKNESLHKWSAWGILVSATGVASSMLFLLYVGHPLSLTEFVVGTGLATLADMAKFHLRLNGKVRNNLSARGI